MQSILFWITKKSYTIGNFAHWDSIFPNFKFFKSNRIGLRHTNPHEKKNIFTHKLHLEPGYGNPPHTYDVPLNSSHFLHIHIWKRLVEFGVRRYVVWVGRGRSSLEGLFRRFSQSRTCVCTCLVGFERVFKTQKKVCIFFSIYILTPCIVTHMNVFLST